MPQLGRRAVRPLNRRVLHLISLEKGGGPKNPAGGLGRTIPHNHESGPFASAISSAPHEPPLPVRKPYTWPPQGVPPTWTGGWPSCIAHIARTVLTPA